MAGNAALLSVFSIIAKVISALYRVPLTSVLGAEGMGMYQLVFSIYALILALTTGGIPVAVSRLTSENNALKKDSRVVLKNALLSVVGTSVVLAAILCVLSGFVARIQGNEGVKSGYYVIAPAVVFVGALSMFRGWFQGNNDVIPTAVSGLFEQVFKLAFGLTLAKILSKYGVIYGVIGALSGVMISEFVALIYIVITYFSRGKIYKINAVESCDKDVRNAILKTSVVFAIAGFIIPFSQFIDGILIVNILKASGESISLATAKYGLYSGTVMSVVNMPVVLSVALSVAIVPVIASATAKRDIDEIRKKGATAVKLAFAISTFAAVMMFAFSDKIIAVLYPRLNRAETQTAVRLLRIISFTVPMGALREIYASMIDKTKKIIVNNSFSVALKIAVTAICLAYFNVYGAGYGMIAFSAVGVILNARDFYILSGKNLKLVKNVSTIAAINVIMFLLAWAFDIYIKNPILSLATGFVVASFAYVVAAAFSGVFDGDELSGVPFSKAYYKLSQKLRFWES